MFDPIFIRTDAVQTEGRLRKVMPKRISRLSPFIASFLALAFSALSIPADAQIVAFGASNVSGWNVAASDAFPAQLQAMLRAKGYHVTVLNAGVYGNTTADMRNRMDSDIPPGTTVVILDTSGEFFNNYTKGISREQGRADLAAIAAALRARGITVIPESTADMPARYRQEDGKHLTPEGHRLVASRLLPRVVQVLGRPR